MKRLFALLVVALIGFYVVWPAWSGYKIATALERQDPVGLEANVDFVAVRESLRPAVTAELDARMQKETEKLGPMGQAFGGNIKQQLLPRLVEQVLAATVNANTVIRVANEGGDVAAALDNVLADAAGQIGVMTDQPAGGGTPGAAPSSGGGGILGNVLEGVAGAGAAEAPSLGNLAGKVLSARKAAATPSTASAPATKRSFGLGNVKSFGFAGPLSFDIAVARDASQAKPDATIGMSFTSGGWKLTRVVPNL